MPPRENSGWPNAHTRSPSRAVMVPPAARVASPQTSTAATMSPASGRPARVDPRPAGTGSSPAAASSSRPNPAGGSRPATASGTVRPARGAGRRGKTAGISPVPGAMAVRAARVGALPAGAAPPAIACMEANGVTPASGSRANDQPNATAPRSFPSMYTGEPLIPATTPAPAKRSSARRTSTAARSGPVASSRPSTSTGISMRSPPLHSVTQTPFCPGVTVAGSSHVRAEARSSGAASSGVTAAPGQTARGSCPAR